MSSSMFDTILRINLKEETAKEWTVPGNVREYIGGIGYGTKILIDEVDPGIDPLSPENLCIITVGPLTGTSAPMHPQTCIVTKSPLTGTILNCYSGGFLGAEIKFCGIDGVILESAGDQWKLLLIEDRKVTFVPAEPVMGKGTAETEAYMRSNFGEDIRTMSIGRAGEKSVAMAGVFSETRTFGRGGAGAVLGSKKIKGIAFRGTKGVDVADRSLFSQIVSRNMEGIKEACSQEYNLVGMFSRVGTGAGVGLINSKGALATRNHTYGNFDKGSNIDGYAYAKNFYTRRIACYGCPVHCGMIHTFKKQNGTESWLRGPEYETMFSLGSDLCNGDPVILAEANQICEEYGMDTLTTGVTAAWAFEMAGKGLLKEPGLKLEFGDADSILGLLRKIGEREGIGGLLALGPKRAAEALGGDSINTAMQIKNSGFAAWMPRRMKGVALAFATSNRGACHKRAPIGAEIMGHIDMDTTEGKPLVVKGIQDAVNAIFTLITCRFHEFITEHSVYPEYVTAATGREISPDEFIRIGEKIWNLERLFNIKAGFGRKDDILPERCFHPVLGENSENAVMEHQQFEDMLTEYYTVRGWNSEGVPTKETLDGLGLEEYIQYL